jgi:Domain of unknown function (DUF3576)
MRRLLRPVVLASLGLLLAMLQGCQYADPESAYPQTNPYGGGGTYKQDKSILGGSGLNILGGNEAPQQGNGAGTGIGVNSFLWRASLDTISFMPLASADPFGGVIITDWYSPPETQAERFKITVYILGRDLRADGVRTAVFRQNRDETGNWIDARVEQKTAVDLEDTILTRARQLRVAGLQ